MTARMTARMTAHVIARTLDAWRGFWFRERSLLDLAISRVFLVGVVLYLDAGGRFARVAMAAPEHWQPIPLLGLLGIDAPGVQAVFWLEQATRVALVAGGLGVLTNLSFALAFVFQLVQEAWLNSLGKVTHATIPILYALFFFALSPCGRRFSIDALVRRLRATGRPFLLRTTGRPFLSGMTGRPFLSGTTGRPVLADMSPHAGWPLDLLFIELAAFYFQAGYAKLQASGAAWADGYTLQFYLLQKQQPAGLWLAEHIWACCALSAAVLVLELGFPVAIVVRQLRPFFLAGGLCFHFATALFMNVVFWPVWALYALFVPWSRVANLVLARVRANQSGQAVARTYSVPARRSFAAPAWRRRRRRPRTAVR